MQRPSTSTCLGLRLWVLLPALLVALVLLASAAEARPIGANHGRQLAGFPFLSGGSNTAAIPALPLDTGGLPITLPPLFGTPGTPSTQSPQDYHKVNCDNPRPTIVLVPGISGSQLDGTQTGEGPCPQFTSPRQIWADISWMKNLACFAHMLSVNYDPSSGMFSNSSGTQLWAYKGGYPDGTQYFIWRTYYNALWKHLTSKYGYQLGVNLYAAPYDWRQGFDGMNQIGQFDQMAARIRDAVKQNCGQKAIIISHSLGVNIALRLLREPRFEAWRKENVQGLVQIGGAFAGASASLWETKLSGVLNPYPALENIFPVQTLAMLPTFPLESAVYQFTLGLPSALILLPTGMAEGPEHVVVQTPRRSYTVAQQTELLRDMGDEQSVLLLNKTIENNKALITAGPIPGVETYCVYGVSVATPETLIYSKDIPYRQPLSRPADIVMGPGDGSMGLKTLRLCSMIAPADHLIEVTDPAVDHAGVVSQPAGLEALTGVLAKFWDKPAAATTPAAPPAAGPRKQPRQQQPDTQPRQQQQQKPAAAAKPGMSKGQTPVVSVQLTIGKGGKKGFAGVTFGTKG